MEFIPIAAVVFLVIRLLSRRTVATDSGAIVGPVGWAAGTDWRVVGPLARADGRRLLRHPSFITGVILTPLMLLAATESENDWRGVSAAIALALVPLGWLTIVATNLLALRPRRTGADELFAALPAPQPVRSGALLAAAVGPVLVAAILAVAWVGLAGTRGDELRGSPEWKEIAVGVLIVAGSVCVGVAVARWLPNAAFGVLAAVATVFIQARFLDMTTWPWDRSEGDPLRFLAFIADPTSAGADFLEVRPAGWHLLYLGGLVVVMAGVALARERLARPVAVVLGVGVLVSVGAGWMQTRPPSTARENAMVAYLTDPAGHQACEESAGVRYCPYPGFTADVLEWRERVDATLALLPAAAVDVRPPLAVIQRAPIIVSSDDCAPVPFEGALPPGVAARLSPVALWPADGHVHPGFEEESFPCSDRDVNGFFLAVQTGAWAVGLPPAPHDRNERCTASGEARAAVALWAGAAASPDGARTLRDVADEGSTGDGAVITFAGWDAPPMWGVNFAVADAEIALAMLELPTAEVRAALDRDWARWTNPRTPSSALANQLGVDGAGSASPANAGCP